MSWARKHQFLSRLPVLRMEVLPDYGVRYGASQKLYQGLMRNNMSILKAWASFVWGAVSYGVAFAVAALQDTASHTYQHCLVGCKHTYSSSSSLGDQNRLDSASQGLHGLLTAWSPGPPPVRSTNILVPCS